MSFSTVMIQQFCIPKRQHYLPEKDNIECGCVFPFVKSSCYVASCQSPLDTNSLFACFANIGRFSPEISRIVMPQNNPKDRFSELPQLQIIPQFYHSPQIFLYVIPLKKLVSSITYRQVQVGIPIEYIGIYRKKIGNPHIFWGIIVLQ